MLSLKYRQLFLGMKYCMATFWWGERLTTLQGPSVVKTQYTHCQEVLEQIGKASETVVKRTQLSLYSQSRDWTGMGTWGRGE